MCIWNSETKKGYLAETFTFNPADYAFESVKFVRVTLMAGFTTVRDLGGTRSEYFIAQCYQ